MVPAVVLGGQDRGVVGVGEDGGEVDSGVEIMIIAAGAQDPVVDDAPGALACGAAVCLVLACEWGDGGAKDYGDTGVPGVDGDGAERLDKV